MTTITQENERGKRMSISLQGILFILIAACMMASASLLLKAGIEHIGGFGGNAATLHQDILALMLQPMIILGVLLYGGGTLLWMRVIATEPLSVGYPILMSVAFIAITLGAALFFKEAITPPKMIGMALIIAGVFVASQG